jgi:hypothetical protein
LTWSAILEHVQPADAGLNRPFRWDLVTPDQLGTLLDGVAAPGLPFAEELTVVAGKVLARSGGGELHFVGRSPDSMFDLLSGALAGTEHAARLHQLAFSSRERVGGEQVGAVRDILHACGITPQTLARSHRPVALVDLVADGGTFGNIYRVLRDWVDDERAPWPVIRRKLHFVGVTSRAETSPKAFRWQENADWPSQLPARAVINVSLDVRWWAYFGNNQVKLTRSYHPSRWTAETLPGRRHDDATRAALAEAVALVQFGREKQTRVTLARTMAAEPAYAESWLRTLVRQLG